LTKHFCPCPHTVENLASIFEQLQKIQLWCKLHFLNKYLFVGIWGISYFDLNKKRKKEMKREWIPKQTLVWQYYISSSPQMENQVPTITSSLSTYKGAEFQIDKQHQQWHVFVLLYISSDYSCSALFNCGYYYYSIIIQHLLTLYNILYLLPLNFISRIIQSCNLCCLFWNLSRSFRNNLFQRVIHWFD